MTTPDDALPRAGVAEPGSEHDPEAAEAYAESVGIDPTPDEIDTYLEIAGDVPLSERASADEAADADGESGRPARRDHPGG